ncbi:hypothetical protein AB0J40_17135 [Amycolatopsis sp. NPDC049691]|uniref:hypothetical protein n=1 Tax=Amycolatopsis sp. NPDC049691 TaxID=3155155 RepID=UPI003438201D
MTNFNKQRGPPIMRKPRRTTLRAHAEHLAAVARAYSDLARRHRSAADAVAREKPALTADRDFTPWLLEVSELAASAERLVAYEVELARSFGVKWDEIAEALGVSRQAAWERFAKAPRQGKSRRYSQAMQARRAEWVRSLNRRLTPEQSMAFSEFERRMPQEAAEPF